MFLRNRALNIAVLVAGFLLFFGVMTQFSWDGMTTFYIAAFTLGLCGLPTTFAGVVVWVGAARALHISDSVTYWVGVIVIAVCFVLQWWYLIMAAQRSSDE